MLNISKGVVPRAQRVVIYGSEGVGKTTLAAHFPEPLIIDTENGSSHLDVRRIDDIRSWDNLLKTIREVVITPDICKTLVLDTADWAERLAITKVCETHSIKSIEAAGYGRGYVYLQETFSELLDALDAVITKGIHVVVTAHAKMRKFEQPDEQGAYDRWEMKLSKNVAPLLKEWCDMLLFLTYKTYVVTTDDNKHKAQGGKRVIYTSHHPCWDAKNRHGLPAELELSYDAIAPIFDAVKPQPTALDELRAKLEETGLTEAALMQVVAARKRYPEGTPITEYSADFIRSWIFKYWPQIIEAANNAGMEDSNG